MAKNIYGIGFVVLLVIVSVLVLQSFGQNQGNENRETNIKLGNDSVQQPATTNVTVTPITNTNMTTNASESSDLKISDIIVGEGAEVKSEDLITVNYKGMFDNGRVFDSSYDRNKPFEVKIGVGQVIPGWDRGIIGMKKGGKRKLIIPPNLAYGPQGIPGTIPPNSTLIFEVELIDIKTQ